MSDDEDSYDEYSAEDSYDYEDDDDDDEYSYDEYSEDSYDDEYSDSYDEYSEDERPCPKGGDCSGSGGYVHGYGKYGKGGYLRKFRQ